jgi:phage baseplate assembly protein W
MGNKILKI